MLAFSLSLASDTFLRRVMGELAFHLLQRTNASLATNPVTAVDFQVANATLPPPMIAHNWESKVCISVFGSL